MAVPNLLYSQKSVPANGVFVGAYSSLLGDKTIQVLHGNRSGLSAFICVVDPQGTVLEISSPLTLQGLPKELAASRDIDQLKLFFQHTHLIPEKGIDGHYNRVSIHMSGKGGGRIKIPFQPGLALGSVVRSETLAKMEEFAAVEAENEAIIEQMNNAEQRIEALDSKIASREGKNGKSDEALKKYWTGEKKRAIELIDTLAEKLGKPFDSNNNGNKIPIFENFQQGVESPIDLGNSRIQVLPLGFDSLTLNSQYIDMGEENTGFGDQVHHLSEAGSFSALASGGEGFWRGTASVSRAWFEATSNRLTQIKKEKKSKGVLVINAMVTTRNVRCLTDLQFDKNKLESILQAMKSTDPQELQKYGIATRQEDKKTIKEIYVLTQAVLGGTFTAFVTVLKAEDERRRTEKKVQEKGNSNSVDASVGVGIFGFGRSARTGHSNTSQSGSQSEDDVLTSLANMKVTVEIISQGSVPIFSRNIIEREILKHLNFNPSQFELSKKDEGEAEKMVSPNGKERIIALEKRRMKMENAQVAVLNTYRGLTAEKQQLNLHTPDSAMEAYESFATQMTSDSDCGVPIGFNYQVFSENRLKEILEEIKGKEIALSNSNLKNVKPPQGNKSTPIIDPGYSTQSQTNGSLQ